MDLHLTDRVILVAGASRGIGLRIAETALKEGAKVALIARGAEALAETHKSFAATYGASKVWSFAGDMRDTKVVETCLEKAEAEFGPIYGAVANVGISPCPLGFDIEDAVWDEGIQQNLNSAYWLARGCMRRFQKRGEGSLVFISSIAGVDGMSMQLPYSVAKAGMNHLSKELSRHAGGEIRVNTVAPGNIKFPGGDWERMLNSKGGERWQQWMEQQVPMKRFGKPEEIADIVVFTLSPRASFMTGALLVVDGGQTR